ncbi:MAG: hypothetical protein ACT4OZ_01910 [Gemmatimonadota bacterium]
MSEPEKNPETPTTIKDGNIGTPMALRDFMGQLGVVMKLPEKERENVAPGAGVAAPKVQGKTHTRLWLPVAGIAVSAWFAVAQLSPAPSAQLPDQLTGVWVTGDKRYAGKQLVLSTRAVQQSFGTVSPGESQRLVSVTSVSRGDTTAVTLVHEADGGTATLSFAYVGGALETLMLKNPSGVAWHRLSDSATVRKAGGREGAAAQQTTNSVQLKGRKPWEH